jgi:SulP family sulfate permease
MYGLGELNTSLRQRGVLLHLAEVKGPVMDRLKHSTLLQALGGRLFLSAAMAWDELAPGPAPAA